MEWLCKIRKNICCWCCCVGITCWQLEVIYFLFVDVDFCGPMNELENWEWQVQCEQVSCLFVATLHKNFINFILGTTVKLWEIKLQHIFLKVFSSFVIFKIDFFPLVFLNRWKTVDKDYRNYQNLGFLILPIKTQNLSLLAGIISCFIYVGYAKSKQLCVVIL